MVLRDFDLGWLMMGVVVVAVLTVRLLTVRHCRIVRHPLLIVLLARAAAWRVWRRPTCTRSWRRPGGGGTVCGGAKFNARFEFYFVFD